MGFSFGIDLIAISQLSEESNISNIDRYINIGMKSPCNGTGPD